MIARENTLGGLVRANGVAQWCSMLFAGVCLCASVCVCGWCAEVHGDLQSVLTAHSKLPFVIKLARFIAH